MELVHAVYVLAVVIAGVLGWIAKQYVAAKNEIIRAREAHIESLKDEINSLKELTPMKIREYFKSVKMQLEEYNDTLKVQLGEARNESEQKSVQIEELRAEGDKHGSEIEKLEKEKQQLEEKIKETKAKAETFSEDLLQYLPLLTSFILKPVDVDWGAWLGLMVKEDKTRKEAIAEWFEKDGRVL